MLNPATLSPQTLKTLLKLRPHTKDFYLAGGTGLALYYQHRVSVDLDFFSSNPLNPIELSTELNALGFLLEDIRISHGTLYCTIENVKVSFMEYLYPVIDDFSTMNNVRIASVLDIAAMKLAAIISRAEKKDYYDIFEILKYKTLAEILEAFKSKFGERIDIYPLLKSLCYFEDIDDAPEPLKAKNTWNEIKKTLVLECSDYMKSIGIE